MPKPLYPFWQSVPKKPAQGKGGDKVEFVSTRGDPIPVAESNPDLPGHEQESDVFRRALRREAVTNIAENRHLVDGRWIAHDQWRRHQARGFFRTVLQSFEAVIAWVFLGLVGLGLMVLIALII